MASDLPEYDNGEAMIPMGAVLEAIADEKDSWATAHARKAAKDAIVRAGGVPHALDAERGVLSAVLLDPSTLADVLDEGLAATDFYRPAHGTIFTAILAVHLRGVVVDTITVVEQLKDSGELERVGGGAAIAQLEALLPTVAHAGSYARLVREKAIARRVLSVAEDLIAAVAAQSSRAGDLVAHAEREIAKVKHATAATNAFAREMQRARDEIRALLGRAKWEKPIGKPLLDLAKTDISRRPPIVQGLVGDAAVVVVAGSPKGGKTWAEDEIGIAVASGTKAFGEFWVNRPGVVLRICLEDAEEDIRNRNIALARGRHQHLDEALGNIFYESRFRLDLLNVDDLAGIIASARLLPAPPALICIDPLADAHSVESENDNAGMRRVMGGPRILRDILGCSVLIVHHLTKSPGDKRDATVDGIFNRFRGGGSIRGAYDVGIAYDVVSKAPGCIKTHIDVETRSGRPPGPFGLQLDIVDGVDHHAERATWSFWRDRSEMTASAAGEVAGDARRVLGALRSEWLEARLAEREPTPMSASAVALKVVMNKNKTGKILADLVGRKMAFHVPGTRNSGYVYRDAGGEAQPQ